MAIFKEVGKFSKSSKRVAFTGALTAITVGGLDFGQTARADFYLHPWSNQHREFKRLDLDTDLINATTASNYDAQGSVFTPAGFEGYQRQEVDLTAAYAFTPHLTLFGRMSWVRAVLSPQTLGSSFGLGDQSIGANYRLFETNKGLSFDVQLQADLPAYNNASAALNNVPYLGDGSSDVTLGAFVEMPLSDSKSSHFSIEAGAGYTYRSADFSAALPWSMALSYESQTGWSIGAGAFGVRSLTSDPRGAVAGPYTTIGAGGSYMVNAINPSFLSAKVEAGYQLSEKFQVHLMGAKTLWGNNSPNSLTMAAGAQYRLNFAKVKGSDRGRNEASNKGFVPYTFEARVVRTNDQLHLVKIDKGSNDGVLVGQEMDIFSVKRDGSIAEPVARAEVVSVKTKEAALKVKEYFREIWIEERFIVKRPLN